MDNNYIQNIIGKYLAGAANKEEKLLIDQWISTSEKNSAEFDLHKEVWENTTIKFRSNESESLFRELLNRIDQDSEVVSEISNGSTKIRRLLISFSKVAAALIFFAAVWYIIDFQGENKVPAPLQTAMIQKQNPAGQKSKIFLPDGSEVWLNAESSISYPEKFSDSTREVSLEGEAFFNVVKNPAKPFIVTAGDVVTTVLGTSFNINAYNNEQNAYIALLSGKVKVDISNDHGTQEMYLEPGEGIRYDKSSRISIKEEFDEDLVLGWKDGLIKFEDASLKEVVSTLSRWYGVTFTIENDSKKTWTYEGTFDNQNLDNVLKSMGFTKEFTYEFDKNNPKNVSIKFSNQ